MSIIWAFVAEPTLLSQVSTHWMTFTGAGVSLCCQKPPDTAQKSLSSLSGNTGLFPLTDTPVSGTRVLAGRLGWWQGTSLGYCCHSRPTLGGFQAEPKAPCSFLLLICSQPRSQGGSKVKPLTCT